ncbi:MAG: ROK family protein [Chloroflexota bacterium]|jgi:glucokinase
MTDLILALDFGGTKLSAAIVERRALDDKRPSLAGLRRVVTPPDADAPHERAVMSQLAAELLGQRIPAAIGISFGGPVDFATGTIRLSHHVRGWEAVPLGAMIAAEFNAPVVVDNDANVAALGEHRFGAGRGYRDLMYLTVSTGVGGGWMLGGQSWRGHEGMAGEIGHTVVDPAGPICLCGKRGCVERLASGPYMAADVEERMRVDPAAGLVLREMWSGEPGTLTGHQVAEAAAAGDELAGEILLRGARALGMGIGNAANLVNPQRFVLGGGVTKAGSRWWAEVRRVARATALPEVRFDIVPSELGDDAPLWGAAALVT